MSFLEIFAPGLRHLREERERQRHDVAHPKVGGPPLGIDLDAGTARITIPAAKPRAASAETSTTETSTTKTSRNETSTTKTGTTKTSTTKTSTTKNA